MKQEKDKVSVLIPARLESARLPGKILHDIGGKPMLERVWHQTMKMKHADEVMIATDSERVSDTAKEWGAQVIMTSPDCQSGTERIASVLGHISGDFILNVQGDEPFIPPQLLDALVERWRKTHCDLVTPIRQIHSSYEIQDPNLVKVVRARDGRAIYFSRSPVPHARNTPAEKWPEITKYWGHIGVYGYQRNLLEAYPSLPESTLENIEKLEQLRFLDYGYCIQTLETQYAPLGVDTLEDLEKARQHFQQSNNQPHG